MPAGVIFCHHRAARGYASRALRALGKLKAASYFSSRSIRDPYRDPNPTPRYVVDDLTSEEWRKLEAKLDELDATGVELYHD